MGGKRRERVAYLSSVFLEMDRRERGGEYAISADLSSQLGGEGGKRGEPADSISMRCSRRERKLPFRIMRQRGGGGFRTVVEGGGGVHGFFFFGEERRGGERGGGGLFYTVNKITGGKKETAAFLLGKRKKKRKERERNPLHVFRGAERGKGKQA